MADMTAFDPEKFEQKYDHYFMELQQAYRNAFERMTEEYDSDLIHGIDQRILAESEPFYDGDGHFRIALPDDASERLEAENLDAVLDRYVTVLEEELVAVFELEDPA